MAYILSLQPHSPLKRSFSDTPYLQSCSSVSLVSSTGTVRHQAAPNLSTKSRASIDAIPTSLRRPGRENTPPQHSPPSSVQLSLRAKGHAHKYRSPSLVSCRSSPEQGLASWKNAESNTSSPQPYDPNSSNAFTPQTGVYTPVITVECANQDADGRAQAFEKQSLACAQEVEANEELLKSESQSLSGIHRHPPFRRWVNTLRKRNLERKSRIFREPQTRTVVSSLCHEDVAENLQSDGGPFEHRKSGSYSSSTGFVTAIKTASVTLASVSIGPFRSHRRTNRGEQRSSGTSDIRASIDSRLPPLTPIIDEATWLRSIQRRKVLEELINTEESYVSDMRTFVNVKSAITSMSDECLLRTGLLDASDFGSFNIATSPCCGRANHKSDCSIT